MPPHPQSLRLFAILLALLSTLAAGCTTPLTARSISTPAEILPQTASDSPAPIPTVRYGRYNLVELVPIPAQRDLMQQIVEITIPPTLDATVGDAMHYVLQRSGYLLCDNVESSLLYALPLPAAHLHLGPLTLRDALLTLAGPAWDISVDDTFRHVCFEPQPPVPILEVQP